MQIDIKFEATVDEYRFLEERVLANNQKVALRDFDVILAEKNVITKNEDDKKCFGGLIVTNIQGDIIVKNTLDVRCDLAFQDSLPDIRQMLFPRSS